MIRKININDREEYLKMSEEFYSSDAVMHTVSKKNFIKTFEMLMKSETYAECYIFINEEKYAGYALLSKTYSNENGDFVYWIEEIYLRSEFRGMGFGQKFFSIIFAKYENFRLEVEKHNERAISLYKRLGFEELPYKQMIKTKI